MSTQGISLTIVENAVSEELMKGDLKKAWERLERRWNLKTREDKVEVYTKFLNYKLENSRQRPMDWIAFMEKKRSELMNTGHIMSDETFITHLLNSLPQTVYEGAILVIKDKLRKGTVEITEIEQILEDKFQAMKVKMRKLWSRKKWGWDSLKKNIFIGDSAATSHMTSRKLGVYDLVPINGSVMIGNGKSISCTHKGKLDVICKHKDGSLARETWEVKIVPELNHDLFSFTKAMKDRWQMNGRWKEGGLMIELFKTTRASMKFDRMIPSGSSWLMGIKVPRVYDEAHAAMEAGKSITATKLHLMTEHTGEHLLKPTANYMKLKLVGRLPPCEACAKAKIRQRNVQNKKIKKCRPNQDTGYSLISVPSNKSAEEGINIG